MPKHKQSSSPSKKASYKHYRDTDRRGQNKLKKLNRQIKQATIKEPVITPDGKFTGDFQLVCRDRCAVEARKRLLAKKN